MWLQKHLLKDESEYINIKQKKTTYFSMDADSNKLVSSWTNYPSLFKFHSIELMAKNSVQVTRRECMDLFLIASEIGGLATALFVFSQQMVHTKNTKTSKSKKSKNA